ncbi:MAG TPA: ethanolamine ammonia-lyase subunit EutC [Rhodanobacter sp.]
MTDAIQTPAEKADESARPVQPHAWSELRRFTQARIALGRSGNSMPTAPLLQFELAHAQARDAVHAPLDSDALHYRLRALQLPSLELHSAAANRAEYLKRPDLGRRLDTQSLGRLQAWSHDAGMDGCDVALVIADGLSSTAANCHALPVIEALLPLLDGQRIGPVAIVRQARVAVGDQVGAILGATMVVMLIGERPGLSATDSLGIYLTWRPHVGCTDAERNCISNIRPAGTGAADAARTLSYLMTEARRIGATGIALKDNSQTIHFTEGTRRIKSGGRLPEVPSGKPPAANHGEPA